MEPQAHVGHDRINQSDGDEDKHGPNQIIHPPAKIRNCPLCGGRSSKDRTQKQEDGYRSQKKRNELEHRKMPTGNELPG